MSQHVKYHIILENLKDYGHQGLNPGSKVHYQLNGIRCDKLFIAVATVQAHPGKYEKELGTAFSIITQYTDKQAPITNIKVAK